MKRFSCHHGGDEVVRHREERDVLPRYVKKRMVRALMAPVLEGAGWAFNQ